ncbi:MAG: alpha/beta hydrolase [Ferruginibacter sp.]
MATNYFILPGLGNSGELHWQTWLERSSANFQRIEQADWDSPACSDWITAIDEQLKNEDLSTVVLIGHSLACATIAHWAAKYKRQIKGAMLVAPSDMEAPGYNFPATGFAPMPADPISFKTIVIASTDDPWVSIERARHFAGCWNSDFINIGKAGHINTTAGFGEWPFVMNLLKTYFEDAG